MKTYVKTLLLVGLVSSLNALTSNSSFAQQTVGLFKNDSTTFDGYTLLFPFPSKNTYLLNNCGHEVKKWVSNYTPGAVCYLKPNGNLLRTAHVMHDEFDHAGGNGGRIEEFDWDGNLVWFANLSDDSFSQHHDIELMPNGHLLVLLWRMVSNEDAVNAGRDPQHVDPEQPIWTESIWEIVPLKDSGYQIVWRWDAMNHLVQDYDDAKANFGIISQYPERLNFNSNYVTDNKDWLHFNSIDYNADLDQIMISCHAFSEIYIIDHSTTDQQSGGHFGGQQNKGGDILYRYGNPAVYGRGTSADQVSFKQHDAQWIPKGYPNAGKILFFNNGGTRAYSSVELFTPSLDINGKYAIDGTKPFGPPNSEWEYTANPIKKDFYSVNMSSVQPLSNGHFLICESTKGHFFEIDQNKNILWSYVNPITATGPITQGTKPLGNACFRAYKYATNSSAFSGKTIKEGDRLELSPLPILCDDTTHVVDTTHHGGIARISFGSLKLFPNPAINNVTVQSSSIITTVKIIDARGVEVATIKPNQKHFEIDLTSFSLGLYHVYFENIEQQITRTGLSKL
ncbi:MAG: aryl-sulfate sulfotransferase [Flavobacteriales bacterium]|nr:aryl-sulfate sulfotransferase [Flavobacteriales bacterium]